MSPNSLYSMQYRKYCIYVFRFVQFSKINIHLCYIKTGVFRWSHFILYLQVVYIPFNTRNIVLMKDNQRCFFLVHSHFFYAYHTCFMSVINLETLVLAQNHFTLSAYSVDFSTYHVHSIPYTAVTAAGFKNLSMKIVSSLDITLSQAWLTECIFHCRGPVEILQNTLFQSVCTGL